MNKLIASGALIGASFGVFGCSAEAPIAATGQCEAVTSDNEVLHPTGYPLGKVAVRYHIGGSWTTPVTTEGFIEQDNNSYYVATAELPTELNNDGMGNGWNNTDAVVFVETPTIEVGLTADCIERDNLNQYGLPTVRVNLPTVSTSEAPSR